MKLPAVLLAALIFAGPCIAATATHESVETLLELTGTRKTVDLMLQQMEAGMRNAMNQSMAARNPSEGAQQIAENAITETMAAFREELSWEKLKDVYVEVYLSTFTQEEVDGLIAFYESAAGRAFVAKMPEIMQKTNQLMQQRMMPMSGRVQQTMQRIMMEARAASRQPAGETPPAEPAP